MLDMKAEALEQVQLDTWSAQPVDRGPAAAAPDPKLLRSWQYQVTGKLATAQVLVDVKAEHIKSGECGFLPEGCWAVCPTRGEAGYLRLVYLRLTMDLHLSV